MKRRQVVLYGDVNLNIMDGSAAWLASLADTLTRTDSMVHVVLKAHVTTDRLLARISNRDDIAIHPAVTAEGSPAMSPKEAVTRLEGVIAEVGADVLIVRGREMSHAAAGSSLLSPILWSYITDYVFPATVIPKEQLAKLRYITQRSRRVFMQTEDSRSYFESIVPEAAGKTLLMTPPIADEAFVELTPRQPGPLRLVYSGKFHPDWRTLEMLQLPEALGEAGTDATLTVVGDKVFSPDAQWNTDMRAGLADPPPGVTWLGALPHAEALAVVSQHDIGLSWRTSNLDSSLEISTKMLEYAAAGTPPLLNRTDAHEQLLGHDYPLFLEDHGFESAVRVAQDAHTSLEQARVTAQEAARAYSYSATAERLERYFQRSEADISTHPALTTPLRVVLAGHDLKFSGELIDVLQMRPDIDLRIDHWAELYDHDEDVSSELLAWADVVICEWAGPNAVWYSSRIGDHQRLLVRLHRFELTSRWFPEIDFDRVDALITVSRYYQQVVAAQSTCAVEKIHAIPNSVDVMDFDRPKHHGARFTIGMVGIVPFLKRPDRALALLDKLVKRDQRFRLSIKGRMPWEYPWIWKRPMEHEAYLTFFETIGSSALLRERVVFTPFGSDMASWLRRVGWVVSPSELESFHLAPAEGMASGALPLFWPRDGVEQIFGTEFLYHDLDKMADNIIATSTDDDLWREAQLKARDIVSEFDIMAVKDAWLDLIFQPAAPPSSESTSPTPDGIVQE